MYNLLIKEIKLAVSPIFYILPFLSGALMLIPGWLYFIVPMYFLWITIPNVYGAYNSQNDIVFSVLMPVTKKDIVKSKVAVIVLLELFHLVIAFIFGLVSTHLYPNMYYIFFSPTLGFWGLCFVMMALFNIIFIPLYFKTAQKYGLPLIYGVLATLGFAAGAEWLGIVNTTVYNIFKGAGTDNALLQSGLLLGGIVLFAIVSFIAYNMGTKRFEKVNV